MEKANQGVDNRKNKCSTRRNPGPSIEMVKGIMIMTNIHKKNIKLMKQMLSDDDSFILKQH